MSIRAALWSHDDYWQDQPGSSQKCNPGAIALENWKSLLWAFEPTAYVNAKDLEFGDLAVDGITVSLFCHALAVYIYEQNYTR